MLFPYIFDYDELFRFLAISVFRTNTTTKVAPTKTTKTTTTHFVSSNALKMLLLVLSFHHDEMVYRNVFRLCPNKLINNENNRSEYRGKVLYIKELYLWIREQSRTPILTSVDLIQTWKSLSPFGISTKRK